MSSELKHIPVLLSECVEMLAPVPGDVVVDCTAGLGGHAAALGEKVGPSGTVVLIDLDPGNLKRAGARVRERCPGVRVVECHASFAEVSRLLTQEGLKADVVLADLGFASVQMDDASRGFSFMREGPLDMRLNPLAPITAQELVNTMPERDLAEMLRDLGEESAARAIARKIAQVRQSSPIVTTTQLADIVRSVNPRRPGMSIDPATKTFQAVRIAVNDELGHLDRFLDSIRRAAQVIGGGADSDGWLKTGARVGIIAFHSLEDRRVKQAIAGMQERGTVEPLSKKPVTPTEAEEATNPRSRSAKLRVLRVGSRSAERARH